MQNSPLVRSVRHWDAEYLAQNFGDMPCSVFHSKNKMFKYSNPSRNVGFDFPLPTVQEQMKMVDFVAKASAKLPSDYYYLQEVRLSIVLRKHCIQVDQLPVLMLYKGAHIGSKLQNSCRLPRAWLDGTQWAAEEDRLGPADHQHALCGTVVTLCFLRVVLSYLFNFCFQCTCTQVLNIYFSLPKVFYSRNRGLELVLIFTHRPPRGHAGWTTVAQIHQRASRQQLLYPHCHNEVSSCHYDW